MPIPLKTLALCGALVLAGCAGQAAPIATAPAVPFALIDAPAPGEWPRPGRDMGDSYFSPLEQISAGNLERLGLAFEFTDYLRRGRTRYGLQSTPLMADGKLFFSGPWGEAYAVNARTGALEWMHDTQADGQYARNACCGVVNRGVALADGKLFVGALDGRLFALDQNTGAVLWEVDTFVDERWNYSLTGAPQIAGDTVIIGQAGADMGARGYVSGYDVETGALKWRFWAVPGDPAAGPDETPEVTLARSTWPEDTRWELGLGGTAWNGLAYDPATNTAFLGLGNGGPHPNWLRSESGEQTDQLFLSSIVAVDPDTGRMKWYYQQTPGDSWDYTATAPMVLADMLIDGEPREVLMQAPKNGIFYVLDRNTGRPLRADPYVRVNWTTGVDLETGRPAINPDVDYRDGARLVWPSGAGGHGWQPMAFSPRTGLAYIPTYDAAMRQQAPARAGFIPGNINQTAHGAFPPFSDEDLAGREQSKFEGRLTAFDPLTGEARWSSAPLTFLNGGTMVAGDLVFQGSASGYLDVYDAASGAHRAHIFLGTVITAAPMTYMLDGVQYIAIPAGASGPQAGFFGPGVVGAERQNYPRLIVLRLDGAPIPLPPPVTALPEVPMPERITAAPAMLAEGRALFMDRCSRCHALGGAPGIYPDLWRMQPGAIAGFRLIVADGLMKNGGMSAFRDQLTDAQIEAIRAFIVNDTVDRRTGVAVDTSQVLQSTH